MDRDIFKFHDGVKDRSLDPIMIDLRLRKASKSVDLQTIMEDFFGPEWLEKLQKQEERTESEENALKIASEAQMEATEKLLPILYSAFQCVPAEDNEAGTTASEIINIYTSYLLFQTNVKKNTENEPNGSEPTATIDPSPTARNTTDSGSIVAASKPSRPLRSGTGSGPRSVPPPKNPPSLTP